MLGDGEGSAPARRGEGARVDEGAVAREHLRLPAAASCVFSVSRRTRTSLEIAGELVALCDAAPTLAPGLSMASLLIVTAAVGVSTPLVHRALPKLPSGGQIALELGSMEDAGSGSTVWPAAAAFCRWLTEQSDEICGSRVLELGSGTGGVGIFAAVVQFDPKEALITSANHLAGYRQASLQYRTERLALCGITAGKGDLARPGKPWGGDKASFAGQAQ